MTITAAEARRLLMGGAGLLADPAGAMSALAIVRRLGFLQLDSINVVERAHELMLHARSDGYRLGEVFRSLRAGGRGGGGRLYEHWTHDASLLPVECFPQWRFRFERYRRKGWHLTRLGADADGTIAEVRERVRRDGPLRSRDFDPPHPPTRPRGSSTGGALGGEGGERGGWWNWKPAKAALEYLWRTGELAVADREGFQKVYDLTERVIGAAHRDAPAPTWEEHVEWACGEALERLGVATPAEIAAFWAAVPIADARRWTDAGLRSGRLVPVEVEGRTSVAFHDVRRRLARMTEPPERGGRVRLLAPFDPLVRDRARCERLFGFRYRFEAFTPAAKREHGYYVLPVLRGDRLIARVDPKHDRPAETLHLRLVGWEPGVRPDRAAKAEVRAAAERLAAFVGAARVAWRGL